MTASATASFKAPALPANTNTLFAAAPGSDIVLSGVLDGHSPDQIWVVIGYTTSETPPETWDDFVGITHDTQILSEPIYSHTFADAIWHFKATINGAVSGGTHADHAWIALVSAAAGTSPGPGYGLLVVLGPFTIRQV